MGRKAYVWDAIHGPRDLDVLMNEAGLGGDLAGWTLGVTRGVSGDGRTLMGYGTNPAGNTEAWIAFLGTAPVGADLNGDGQIDCVDVDSLVAEIVAGTNGSDFDLTGDGLVNRQDLDEWRIQGGAANLPSGNPYLIGDANLDGVVDGQDFIAWNIHKFTNEPSWCHGDFTADGVIDGQDYVAWNIHKFTSSDGVSAVPEPGLVVSLIGVRSGWHERPC